MVILRVVSDKDVLIGVTNLVVVNVVVDVFVVVQVVVEVVNVVVVVVMGPLS